MAFNVDSQGKINEVGNSIWPTALSISLNSNEAVSFIELFVDIFSNSTDVANTKVTSIAPSFGGWTKRARVELPADEFSGDTLIKEIWYAVASSKLTNQAVQITVGGDAFADICYSGCVIAGVNTASPFLLASPVLNSQARTSGTTLRTSGPYTITNAYLMELFSVCGTGPNGGGNPAPQFTPADGSGQGFTLIENNPNLEGNFGSGSEWRTLVDAAGTYTFFPFNAVDSPGVTTYDWIVYHEFLNAAVTNTPARNFTANAGF